MVTMGAGRVKLRLLILAGVLCAAAARVEAAIDVRLVADQPLPVPAGTVIHWSPEVAGPASPDFWYRYRVREEGGSFRIVRDFGPESSLEWTSIDGGQYTLELAVRDRLTGEIATTTASVELRSRVVDGKPAIAPTRHPLVYHYSAPCAGERSRVRVASARGIPRFTPWKECPADGTASFYLAGLRRATEYSATLETGRAGLATPGSTLGFTTGDFEWDQPLPRPSIASAGARERILLQGPLFRSPVATDLDGELVWFGPANLSYLTNPGPGGTFWGLETSVSGPDHDRVRQFDLLGLTVRETNAARVNEQLATMGRRAISGFHHEARPLDGGRVAVLATVEQVLTGVQGSAPVNILGDMILVLDSDMQVVWAWDAFDHLDPTRAAILGETCLAAPGCPKYYLTKDANDWTHGNSVTATPDGSALLYSARHQDWVVKIDYLRGEGSGEVIWRLGKDGDFVYDSTDSFPWFSHQHDARPLGDGSTIVLFDNANTRAALGLGANSRGQAIELDEASRVARLSLNADLGVYAGALGSAQQLEDGGYHFNAGLVFPAAGPPEAYSIEIDRGGSAVRSLKVAFPVYRSFRLADLYGEETPARGRPARRSR